MTLVDHSFLVDSMKDPAFYPHPVEGGVHPNPHLLCVPHR